ncbi:NDP-sugar synthase [Priestia megaterium]|nr:NDP-sugar synthase [Priestia megaterium]
MKAIILAGGKGTRLQPLTNHTPKPMLPLYDKPVMEYSIELLKKYGIKEIGITLQYLYEQIIEYFGDGSKWGVSFTYFIEETPLGTAGGIKKAESFIEEECLIISGDALTDINLADVIAFHKEKNSEMTIVTKVADDVTDYGVVSVNEQYEVKSFIEKPNADKVNSNLINTGIYLINKSVLTHVGTEGPTDFSFDVIPSLLYHRKKVYSFITKSYWIDIGQVKHYRQAHYDLYGRLFSSSEKNFISSNVEIDLGVILSPPVYIGENTVIKKGATIGPWTVIGANNKIKEHSTIRSSVLMSDVKVGQECVLHDVTLGAGTSVQNFKWILNDTVGKDSTADTMNQKTSPLFVYGRNISCIMNTREERQAFILAMLSTFRHVRTFSFCSDEEEKAKEFFQECITYFYLHNRIITDLSKETLLTFRSYMTVSKSQIGVYIGFDRKNDNIFLEIYDDRGQLINSRLEREVKRHYNREYSQSVKTLLSAQNQLNKTNNRD